MNVIILESVFGRERKIYYLRHLNFYLYFSKWQITTIL